MCHLLFENLFRQKERKEMGILPFSQKVYSDRKREKKWVFYLFPVHLRSEG
jgi:hypothetical protein